MADTKTLKLEVIMAAVDRITGPLKALMNGSRQTSGEVKALRDRIKELNAQSNQIEGFRKLQSQTAVVGHSMTAAQDKVRQLAEQIKAAELPTKTLTRAFEAAKREAGQLTTQHQEMTVRLQRQRDALNAAGLATTELASHQRRLRTEVQSTTTALDAEQKKLDEINQRAQRMHAARANYDKAMATRDKALSAGVTAGATGGAIVWGLDKTVHQASEYQKEVLKIKALGMGDHVTQDADKFARGMKVYGTSMLENVDMMRDGLTIFADLHHAEMALPVMQKMKFANAALYGEAAGNEKSQQLYDMLKVVELRGGTKDSKAFNDEAELIQKVMSSTGGRVGAHDYRNLIQTGGVAAKQLNPDVFYNVLEPMVQEMGGDKLGTGLMSAFQNLYLGKTTTAAARTMLDLGLLQKDKVEYDKVGQLKRMHTGAIIGADTYKTNPFEWLETHFLPALAKKGITDPSKVNDMLATVVTNRKGSDVFATYLMQKDAIKRSADRNRGAFGIDQTYATAKESADGKKLALHKRFEDVQMLMGERLLPVYIKLLDLLTWVTDAVGNFAEKHPALVTVLGYTAAAVGGLLLVFGGLAIAVAGVLGPFALARLAMTTLGLAGFTLPSILGLASAALGYVSTALRALGTALLWVGRLFLSNPILAVAAAIAAAAVYVWANWDTLGPKFWALWESIKTGASTAWAWVTEKARAAGQIMLDLFLNWTLPGLIIQHWDSITAFMSALPAKFATLGGQIIDGLITGVSQRWETAKAWFADMGGKIAQTVRDALGIKSPSRVFADIGGQVMGGLTLGLDGGEDGALARIKATANKLTAAGGNFTLAAGLAMGSVMAPAATTAPELPAPLKTVQQIVQQTAPFQAAQQLVQQAAPLPMMGSVMAPAATTAPELPAPLKTVQQIVQQTAPFQAAQQMVQQAAPLPVMSAAIIIDTRPPITASAAAAGAGAGLSVTNQITINAAPGMDEAALASLVAAEIEKATRRSQVARRSRLDDQE